MTDEILHKLKKVLRIVFLVVVGIVLFFVAAFIYFYMSQRGTLMRDTVSSKGTSVGNFGVSGGVNIAVPDMFGYPSAEENLPSYDYSSIERASNPPLSTSERKLIQNGALSLAVDRVEDAVTKLAAISEKLGGRIDSVSLYNDGGIAKKHSTVVMRVPAVNFGAGMEQAKNIARKVLSENISTEDITEKFIDMQARLKNLRAEETQYLEIMQKAVKIEDVLRVSQRLYAVRQQIEQLQGQMNYLSRQVDMSVITIELSSDPDIEPTNVVWSPSTTVKETINGFLEGFYGFLDILIRLFLGLVPLVILFGSVIILLVWFIWKLLLFLKKRIHIDVKKHQIWYNDNILTDNKK